MRNSTIVSMIFAFGFVGCERSVDKPSGTSTPHAAGSAKPTDDHDHKPGDGHDHGGHDDHAHDANGGHGRHGGEVVELGSTKVGGFDVRASRDKGDIKPGGDAPIDVWIDGGVGKGVAAVRFWIGTEDAKGSVKAKADIEDGKWHTHVEIPSPIPTGSKLWVEIEETAGKKSVGSFALGG